jgi:hypothetical protein
MRKLITGAALVLIVSGVSTRVLGSRRAMSAHDLTTQR